MGVCGGKNWDLRPILFVKMLKVADFRGFAGDFLWFCPALLLILHIKYKK